MQRLMQLVQTLRNPVGGCPWDLQQDLSSYRKYLQEEMRELLAAIEKADQANLAEELGDNLFNLAYVLELAREKYGIQYDDVIRAAADKMIGRHPHVFGDVKAASVEDAIRIFYEAKARQKGGASNPATGKDAP